MEMWDCYSAERQKLGRLHPRAAFRRGRRLSSWSWVWTVNRKGEILLTKRHPDKPCGLLWEMTGGSVLAGKPAGKRVPRAAREVGVDLRA